MSDEILMTHIQESDGLEQILPYTQTNTEEYKDPLEDMTLEEIEIIVMKEKATRCKVIALESLGHHPLANPSNMGRRDKKKVLDVMTMWFHSKSNEEIETEFNDIIDDKVLGSGNDYSKYVENNNIRHPRIPDDMKKMIVNGVKIDCEGMNDEIDRMNTEMDDRDKISSITK